MYFKSFHCCIERLFSFRWMHWWYNSFKNNASKHKSQFRISRLLGFSKNSFAKNSLEFYLIYNRFGLKCLRSKLQKLGIAIFGHLSAQIERIFHFGSTSKMFFRRQSLHSKISLNILKPLIYFESKLIWNSKTNWDPKTANFEFKCFNRIFKLLNFHSIKIST